MQYVFFTRQIRRYKRSSRRRRPDCQLVKKFKMYWVLGGDILGTAAGHTVITLLQADLMLRCGSRLDYWSNTPPAY